MVSFVRTLIGSPSFMHEGFFGTTPFSILLFVNNPLTYTLHFDVDVAVYCESTKFIGLYLLEMEKGIASRDYRRKSP